jgi:hypothetical protein
MADFFNRIGQKQTLKASTKFNRLNIRQENSFAFSPQVRMREQPRLLLHNVPRYPRHLPLSLIFRAEKSMDLQSAIEKSELWMVLSSSLVDGLEIDSTVRNRVAASLFHLCTEHQQSAHTLTNHGLLGSAFALMRPQFEAYVRGVWYHRCASDSKLNSFVKGAEPPKISALINEIGILSDFDSQSLLETKRAVWGVLNDFTHGGSVQVRARITANEIDRNYKSEHIIGMLRWSSVLSFMGYVGMAAIAENDVLANNLLDNFHSIYAGSLTPIN